MSWFYQGVEVELLPEDCIGFVYLITNTVTGRKYIGKKLAKFSKTTYKTFLPVRFARSSNSLPSA